MTITSSNESNGTSSTPSLCAKQPAPSRRVLSPPRAQQMPRNTRASAGFPFVRLVKMSLYFWTVVAITFGVMLACFVLYLLFLKNGGSLAPTLPFSLAAYGSLTIALASCIGLYGLLQHRKIVTEGRRNYSLGMCIVLSTIGAIIVMTAGAMGFSLVSVVDHAQDEDFSNDRVVAWETHVILSLHAQVKQSSSSWYATQSALKCCGYDQVSAIRSHLSASSTWDLSLLQSAVEDVNAVGGKYCSARLSECMETMSEAHCPISGHGWCRAEVLHVARENYLILSACAISFGTLQLFFSAFGLFILLCDVRRLRNMSPISEISRHVLSPIPSNAH